MHILHSSLQKKRMTVAVSAKEDIIKILPRLNVDKEEIRDMLAAIEMENIPTWSRLNILGPD